MKTLIAAIVSLAAGFGIGCLVMYKPVPIGTQQIDSTALMDLSNHLSTATNQVATAAQREGDLKDQIANLNSALSAANDQITKLTPLAAQARKVPVKISRRNGFTGLVYQFSNLSGKSIRMNVTLGNGGSSKKFSFVADTTFPNEIGKLEGWQGASGDTVTVESAGYDPVVINF